MPELPVMPVPVVVGRITIDIFWLIRNIGIGTISAVSASTVFKFSIRIIEKPEVASNPALEDQRLQQHANSGLAV